MIRIVDRDYQKITSKYGWRLLHGKPNYHNGVDLRSYDDERTKKLNIVLPCECFWVRSSYQHTWGWTHVFLPVASDADEIRFSHMEEMLFTKNKIYKEGDIVGQTAMTSYMIENEYPEHLHFSVWKKEKHYNPIKFFKEFKIDYKK